MLGACPKKLRHGRPVATQSGGGKRAKRELGTICLPASLKKQTVPDPFSFSSREESPSCKKRVLFRQAPSPTAEIQRRHRQLHAGKPREGGRLSLKKQIVPDRFSPFSPSAANATVGVSTSNALTGLLAEGISLRQLPLAPSTPPPTAPPPMDATRWRSRRNSPLRSSHRGSRT